MAIEQELKKTNPLHKEFQNLLDEDFKDRKLKENEIIKMDGVSCVNDILKSALSYNSDDIYKKLYRFLGYGFDKDKDIHVINIEMSEYQFGIYEAARAAERKQETNNKINARSLSIFIR